jgi:hypothetical protein
MFAVAPECVARETSGSKNRDFGPLPCPLMATAEASAVEINRLVAERVATHLRHAERFSVKRQENSESTQPDPAGSRHPALEAACLPARQQQLDGQARDARPGAAATARPQRSEYHPRDLHARRQRG